jgi:hypothetical protein
MLIVVGPAHDESLYVTSKPKEIYQVFQEFSDQSKIIADEIIHTSTHPKDVGAARSLRAKAEQADRDAARAMELEPDLAFDSIL